MELIKKEKEALVLDIRKPIMGQNEIARKGDGTVINEGQEVSYITLLDLQKNLKGLIMQGFTIISVKSYGTFLKEDVNKILQDGTPKVKKSKDEEIEELKKQMAEILKQNKAKKTAE